MYSLILFYLRLQILLKEMKKKYDNIDHTIYLASKQLKAEQVFQVNNCES